VVGGRTRTSASGICVPAGFTAVVPLKITIVERLFHVGRDKLMSIPAFARAYEYLMSLLSYLHSLPIWQAMLKRARAVKGAVRRISAFAKKWAASLKAG
jgi:hypothetical protein